MFKYFDLRYLGKKVMENTDLKNQSSKVMPFIKQKSRQFIEECHESREKLKDIPGTNYRLGISHMQRGNISDAILRFRMVSFLTPENIGAHYNLGRCLLMAGENKNAKSQFEKTLTMDNNHNEAKYMLAKLENPKEIKTIPLPIIKEHTDLFAEIYETAYLHNGYLGHQVLTGAILTNTEGKNPNLEVLDLGCGIGICGDILKDKEVTKKIVGVDVSNKMVKAASALKIEGENVYNQVLEKDIRSFLAGNKDKYDVIMSDSALQYYGDFVEIVGLIKKALKPKGMVAITMPKNEEKQGYMLDIASDEFVHSQKYVEEQFTKAGFAPIQVKDCNLFDDNDGVLFLYRLDK